MTHPSLVNVARQLVAGDKGLLAIDESTATCNARFAKLDIPQTEDMRRQWRELIITTPSLNEAISGIILYEETIGQQTKDSVPFIRVLEDAGMLTGIKVDTGAKDLAGHPGEKITEGLDGLRDRLSSYRQMGARFAKWRAVIELGAGLPSRGCIEGNAHALARYAALCQEADIVPIVEAEVMMTGDHTLKRSHDATDEVLYVVFEQLRLQQVQLDAMILKPNMVLSGLASVRQAGTDEIVGATLECLLRVVPAAVTGIAFLSGGQSGPLASARLNAINASFKRSGSPSPWPLTFSFGRAIQQPALEIWHGDASNLSSAQDALYHRACLDRAARQGIYTEAMEST